MEKNKPIVLLPYCVEKINRLEKLAKEQGFRTEILMHGDEIQEILDKYHPSFVLGVACSPQITKIGDYVRSKGYEGEGVPVECQSCMKKTGKRTKIDEIKYIEALERLKQWEKNSDGEKNGI